VEGTIAIKLPGKPESCWTATSPETAYPKLIGSGTADVAVVGAGIVGLTTAYLLAEAGLSVAVLEARRVGRQVTGRSTAKITTQHSLVYRHLIQTFGLEIARHYAEANRLGINQIRQWVERLGIACDFESKDAEGDHGWHLKAGGSSLQVKHVVLATNLPIAGPVRYDQRTRPRSHVAMAFRIDQEAAIDGMFIGVDEPTHSLRMGRDQDGLLLVVLGAKFNTGQEGDVAQYFRDLEAWTRGNFEIGDTAWRWVNEDYDTADRVPFAGAVDQAPALYIATGFNAWGISNGTAAGILIAKQILGEPPHWASVYNPARKASKKFNKGGDTQSLVNSLDDIEQGGGGRHESWPGQNCCVARQTDRALRSPQHDC
jgi:glycine/D-amino acid oxidase-like deaminating enzyme